MVPDCRRAVEAEASASAWQSATRQGTAGSQQRRRLLGAQPCELAALLRRARRRRRGRGRPSGSDGTQTRKRRTAAGLALDRRSCRRACRAGGARCADRARRRRGRARAVVALAEGIEDHRQQLGRDADAGVVDGDLDAAVARRRAAPRRAPSSVNLSALSSRFLMITFSFSGSVHSGGSVRRDLPGHRRRAGLRRTSCASSSISASRSTRSTSCSASGDAARRRAGSCRAWC